MNKSLNKILLSLFIIGATTSSTFALRKEKPKITPKINALPADTPQNARMRCKQERDLLEQLKTDIKNGANVNEKDENKDTPLIAAAKNNSIQTLKLLLKNDAYVNERDANNNTTLFMAVQNDNLKMVEILLNSGADVYKWNNNDDNVLIIASGNNNLEMVILFIEALKNKQKVAYTYVLNGFIADYVNSTNKDGDTALFNAVKNNNPEMVQFLINNGANLNARNTEGLTAAQVAENNGYKEIQSLL